MAELGQAVPLAGEVFDWLGQRGIAPAGPPFWRYLTIEMPDRLEIECGVTVGATIPGDDRVLAGELPAGRYATVLHDRSPRRSGRDHRPSSSLGRPGGARPGRQSRSAFLGLPAGGVPHRSGGRARPAPVGDPSVDAARLTSTGSLRRAARPGPLVDARLHRLLVDLGQFVGGEIEPLDRGDVVLELGDAARADQGRGDPLVPQHPGEGQLGEALTASLGDLVQRADPGQGLLGDRVPVQRLALGGPRVGRHSVEVPIR